MLYRHGYGLANGDDDDTVDGDADDDEEWRKGKAVLCGHSLGGGPCAWVLRDAVSLFVALFGGSLN
jgi:hypothetical protein